MMIPFKTMAQRRKDRLHRYANWTPVFLLLPRRVVDPKTGSQQQYFVVGRCVRKLVSRDRDGMAPYKWTYMDRAHAVSQKLISTLTNNLLDEAT